MAVGDAYVFPGFLKPILTQLFFPKPQTSFLTCFYRGERWKYAGKKSHLNQGSNSQPPGHESDTLTDEPPRWQSLQTLLVDWLIIRCLMLSSTVFQLYHSGQCTYPCFSGVLLTSTLHNILSKPLAAFANNRCQNNGQQWERNESCIGQFGDQPATSCSQVCNATDWAMGLGNILGKAHNIFEPFKYRAYY